MAWKFSGKKEVYVEIAERYENYITLGIIKSGDKLPSVRRAAEDCGVNPNTVARAYELLEKKGIIKTLPKKGIYVSYGESSVISENDACLDALRELKKKGVTLEQIMSAVNEIYKGESTDD